MVTTKEANLQNNINKTFIILIKLFQKQANKLNSRNWLEMQKPKLNTNIEVNEMKKKTKTQELVARPHFLH